MQDVSSYLSHLIDAAIGRRASDIHLEPLADRIQIRMRIDGELLMFEEKSEAWGPPLISKLKLLANLDIGERRIPQDGGFSHQADSEALDIRVSTLPTIHGEKLVLRLLKKHLPFQQLSSLGFDPEQIKTIRNLIFESTAGLLLATGPTGSGKTTTIHTLIQEIRRQYERNIIALEDPVEYQVSGVNQVQVNPKAGLTFTTGLRAILRQDPDVIYVGEIRDRETVEIAIRAALTGRLVLSSLHTPDAAGTITRLVEMGIEPYLITSALRGVIAQRLIRRVCSCAQRPCPYCQDSGYFGREAIFEVLPMDDELRQMIMNRSTVSEIRNHLRDSGFHSLNMNLREKVRTGITTLQEYQRAWLTDVEG
ncbi:hypothetical protein BEP19_00830 [Ammoniphilus oxalaticus]|uniref:AAA+ ATPase domain-containing protein n=1 Tax=Ammoniphilus oxalaticus TaxID=66863 RepID=A0A419SMQ2_9BACL|nr:GspE/PulE family protein [Ammoniphilus oxalaticus]RKD25522.1 hypothetical protein BEP19_00830 [Ammoniphilus oxalaticus]